MQEAAAGRRPPPFPSTHKPPRSTLELPSHSRAVDFPAASTLSFPAAPTTAGCLHKGVRGCDGWQDALAAAGRCTVSTEAFAKATKGWLLGIKVDGLT
eukprot:188159-Chlamydomonas_euryale.AAC.1